MKKKLLVLSVAILTLVGVSNAQLLKFGVKGGVSSTKVKFDETTLSNVTTTSGAKDFLVEQGKSKLGIHFGLFARVKVAALYVQPEVLFTQTKGEVLLTDVTGSTIVDLAKEQKFNKIDVPVMIGWKLGPARIGLGPVASFVISEKDGLKDELATYLDNTTTKIENEFNKATFGYQVGVGLDILKIATIDLKYEGNLSKLGSGVTIGGVERKFDQRNPQVILSVGIFF
jgi:hypothetical protein